MVKTGILQKATDSLGGTPFDIFDDVRELGIEGLDHCHETKSIQMLEYGKGKRWAFPFN